MTISGFAFYGIAAWLGGDAGFALLNLSIASSAAAFLVFNFHPARVFMGDVGSIALGFLAAALGIHGWCGEIWPWWLPLVFSPSSSTPMTSRVGRCVANAYGGAP
jgi:UDP-N-acetylmuramyl pentapeptide phosphotransferase/UDP-N-acetylglucosamine-1-phosphate transferase